jgi:hypothetical protein
MVTPAQTMTQSSVRRCGLRRQEDERGIPPASSWSQPMPIKAMHLMEWFWLPRFRALVHRLQMNSKR